MSSIVINVQNLSKHFKTLWAVNNLSFTVNEGEVYGFLGQNGAGKSTTIRMLLTLVKPTSGSIFLFGKEMEQHRSKILQRVGAIIEKPDLYNYLTALQNLSIMAKLSKATVSKKVLFYYLQMVGLAGRENSKVKTYSQGMKQRLGIACALVHQPELLILDEPTNGLDPQGIADMRNLIMHLSKNEKKTIVVSSHLLSEVELIADSMLIIDNGKKIAEGRRSDLLNPSDMLVEISTTDNEASLQKIQQSVWNQYLQKAEDRILLRLHKNLIPQLNRSLVAMNIEVIALQPKHSLEDYFLSLTTTGNHVAAHPN